MASHTLQTADTVCVRLILTDQGFFSRIPNQDGPIFCSSPYICAHCTQATDTCSEHPLSGQTSVCGCIAELAMSEWLYGYAVYTHGILLGLLGSHIKGRIDQGTGRSQDATLLRIGNRSILVNCHADSSFCKNTIIFTITSPAAWQSCAQSICNYTLS